MAPNSSGSKIGLLLSGGLDSGILLGRLLEQGHSVQPFYVRSQLVWEEVEQAALQGFLEAMASKRLAELVVLDMPLADVYEGHWSLSGEGTPGATSPAEAVYLPGRNALLVIKAAVWCQRHGIRRLALGVLASNPFADAGWKFFSDLQSALNVGLGSRLRIVRPFARLGKRRVMQLGRHLPLAKTFSCIAPMNGLHCGQCNKCAERRDAFELIGMRDPTVYALTPVPE